METFYINNQNLLHEALWTYINFHIQILCKIIAQTENPNPHLLR